MTADPTDNSAPDKPADAKKAVAVATEFVRSLYGSNLDIGVEEVDFDSTKGDWLITVGFWRELPEMPNPTDLFATDISRYLRNTKYERVYKVVRVKQSTGAPLSMKIRDLGEKST
jgi:hypothetical protein